MNPPITRIDLLRHGEPIGDSRYRGCIDDPLSPLGWQQLHQATAGDCPWQRVFSSPLQRCAAFAEEFASTHNRPVVLDARLREIGFGDWEGKTAEEIRRKDPEALRRFYADPIAYPPPRSESPFHLIARVGSVLAAAIGTYAGQHLLVVCHTGVIRAAIAWQLQLAPSSLFRMRMDHAHFTRLELGGERPGRLIFHNRPGPLSGI